MPNYWIMRTDRRTQEIKDFLWQELQQGRLRQGWGYLEKQNLLLLDGIERYKMTDEQRQSWRGNRRMLELHGDGVQSGDIMLIPHLPQEGAWSIVRRTEKPYEFDLANGMDDYGHLISTEIISKSRPVNFQEEAVAAGLRATMRNMGRLWNINHLGADVERLITALNNNAPADKISNRIPNFVNTVEEAAWEALKHNFKGSEFEGPCLMLLRSLYGENAIEHTAGPNERGADAICTWTDPLGISSRVAVQMKMWDWDADSTSPLHQLRQAYGAYDGITAGIVMATSAQTTSLFEEKRKELEAELRIPIKVILRKELMKLFLMHLPGMISDQSA